MSAHTHTHTHTRTHAHAHTKVLGAHLVLDTKELDHVLDLGSHALHFLLHVLDLKQPANATRAHMVRNRVRECVHNKTLAPRLSEKIEK